MELNYFYVFSFIAIAILLFLSALISASEVAFFSLRANDLDRCRESNDPRDNKIVDLLKRPRLLLASILILNNFVNVGVVTIATFLMWEMTSTHNPSETIVGVVTFTTTFAITFFGEIIPKVYAVQRNMFIARMMSGVWKVMEKICMPVSFLLLGMTSVIERRIEKRGYSSTVEELNQALELTTDNAETSEDEKEILKGIVNFGTLTVKQVMRSRLEISAIEGTKISKMFLIRWPSQGSREFPFTAKPSIALKAFCTQRTYFLTCQRPRFFNGKNCSGQAFLYPRRRNWILCLKIFKVSTCIWRS